MKFPKGYIRERERVCPPLASLMVFSRGGFMSKSKAFLQKVFSIVVAFSLITSCVSADATKAFADELRETASSVQSDNQPQVDAVSDDTTTDTIGPYPIPNSNTNVTGYRVKDSSGNVLEITIKFGPSGESNVGQIAGATLSSYMGMLSLVGINKAKVTKIETDPGFTINFSGSLEYLFSGFTGLSDISGLSGWNVSAVTSMKAMFGGCTSLASLEGVNNWDVSNVTDMSYMFYNCTSLIDTYPLNNWNTSSVTYIHHMFAGCSLLETIYAQNWDLENLTQMGYIFSGCTKLSNIDTLSDWNITKVKDLGYVFNYCESLPNVNALAKWDVSKVESMTNSFTQCHSLTDISGLSSWNTSSMLSLSGTFQHCTALKTLHGLEGWDVSKVTDFDNLFFTCGSLIDITALINWKTSSAENMAAVFSGSHLEDISPLENWDVSSVTAMNSMFSGCKFSDCDSLKNWDVSKVTNMNGMFSNTNVSDISGLVGWNVANVTNMISMLYGSQVKSNYDIAGWDLNSSAQVQNMFTKSNTATPRLKYVDLSLFRNLSSEMLAVSIFEDESNIEFVKMPESVDVFKTIQNVTGNKSITPEYYGSGVKYKYNGNLYTTNEVLADWDTFKNQELQIVASIFYIKYVYGANLESSTQKIYNIDETAKYTPDAIENATFLGWAISETSDSEVKFGTEAQVSQSQLEATENIEKTTGKVITYTLYAKYHFDPTQYVFVDFEGFDPKTDEGASVSGYTRTMYIPLNDKKDAKLVNSRYVREGYTQTAWRGYKNGVATSDIDLVGNDSYIDPSDFDVTDKVVGSETQKHCTLYAVWSVNTYYVKYKVPQTGDYPKQYTGLGEDTAVKFTDEITLPDAIKVATAGNEVPIGKKITSWNTDQSGSGTSYEPNGKYSGLSTGSTSGTIPSVILYAFWDYIDYTITYKNIDGAQNSNQTIYNYSSTTSIPLVDARRTGYTFEGWWTQDGTTDGQWGTQVTAIAKGETGDKTVYAKWSLNEYSVTYKEADGTEITELTPTTYTVETNEAGRKLPTLTKAGYTFDGWYTDTALTKGPVASIPADSADNLTYYAKWSLNTYSVTYKETDDTVISGLTPNSYTINTDAAGRVLPTPTKTGYKFGGWYANSSLTGTAVTSIPTDADGNLTYYAKFDIISYTVKFNANGGVVSEGSSLDDQTLEYNQTGTLPSVTRSGFQFKGWYKDGDASKTYITELKNLTTDDGVTITLVADWSAISEGTTNDEGKVVITKPDGSETYEIDVTIDDDDDPSTPNIPVPDAKVYVDDDGVIHVVLPEKIDDPENPGDDEKKITVKEKDVEVKVLDENDKGDDGNKKPIENKDVEVKDKDNEGTETDRGTVPTNADGIAKFASIWNITYVLNLDGVVNENATTYKHGEGLALKDPSKSGYKFLGWYQEEDFSGEKITSIPSDWAKDVTLYANWQEMKTTLTVRTFNGNGSLKINGVAASQGYVVSVEEGQTITLTWRPTAVSNSNNINFIKAIKFNGADQGAVSKVNKSNWQELNTEYKRRMKETYKMTTIDRVLATDQTLTFKIGNVDDNYLDIDFQEVAPVYRMYNMITSEHLFTTDKKEYDDWVAIGKKNKDYWLGEGVDWFSPVSYVNDSKTPKVYRLYNPGLGALTRMSHYYTSSKTEMEDLCKNWGWKKETQFSGKDGCVFLSDDTGSGVPIFTAYSEALRSSHHYTSSSKEWKGLDGGWDKEKSKNIKNGKETGFFRATLSAKPE